MNESQRETLSALMDDEANELELRRLLKSEGNELLAQWGDYQRIRTALTGEGLAFAHLDISQAVSDGIAGEDTLRHRVELRRPLAGIAVAASVAALVVFGLGGERGGIDGTGTREVMAENTQIGGSRAYPASVETAVGSVTASAGASAMPSFKTAEDEAAKHRFEQYMLRHTERAVNSGQGMISYARVVDYEGK